MLGFLRYLCAVLLVWGFGLVQSPQHLSAHPNLEVDVEDAYQAHISGALTPAHAKPNNYLPEPEGLPRTIQQQQRAANPSESSSKLLVWAIAYDVPAPIWAYPSLLPFYAALFPTRAEDLHDRTPLQRGRIHLFLRFRKLRN